MILTGSIDGGGIGITQGRVRACGMARFSSCDPVSMLIVPSSSYGRFIDAQMMHSPILQACSTYVHVGGTSTCLDHQRNRLLAGEQSARQRIGDQGVQAT